MVDAVCPLLSLVYVLIQYRFYIPVVSVRGRLWWIFAKKSRGAWRFLLAIYEKMVYSMSSYGISIHHKHRRFYNEGVCPQDC